MKLRDSWVVLDRAKGHVDDLKADLDRWAKDADREPPWDMSKQFEENDNCFVFTVISVAEMPVQWSTMIGDAVTNYRSALDYLAQVLVRVGSDPTPKRPTKVTFPIWDDVTKFDADIRVTLPGVDTMHLAIVRRYQPYKRGALASDHPLASLRELVKGHKHYRLQPSFAQGFGQFHVDVVNTENFTVTRVEPGHNLVNTPVFEVGTEITRIYGIPDAAGEPNVTVAAQGTLSIAFDNGKWVADTLNHIGATITELLGEIEPIL